MLVSQKIHFKEQAQLVGTKHSKAGPTALTACLPFGLTDLFHANY
jgi:hypothetical protein